LPRWGESGLADYVDRQFALAAMLTLSSPPNPTSNARQRRSRTSSAFAFGPVTMSRSPCAMPLISDGSFHLSTAELCGKRYLRATFMNPETTLEDVQRLVTRVRKAGEAYETRRDRAGGTGHASVADEPERHAEAAHSVHQG